MATKISFATLTLIDTLDLAVLIEAEDQDDSCMRMGY